MIFVSLNPALEKSARNSASVRSRPPGKASISRSIHLPRSGAFPGCSTVYERVDGTWQRLSARERAARVMVHGETLRLVPVHDQRDAEERA